VDRKVSVAAPPEALFPDDATRERVNDALTRRLAEAEQRVASGSVVPTLDMEVFRRELAAIDFEHGQSLDALLEWTIGQLEQGLVHLNHPRYFGLFNPAPTFPAQVAERVAASFNPQLATWTTSPAAVEIEAHVMNLLGRRAGLTGAVHGHFTSGGSEANFTAAIAALTAANPRYAEEGVLAFGAPVAFYVSAESHLAWIKIAHMAGLGRRAARLVATDGHGRISVAALEQAISEDRARGIVPFMISATAGTTGAGMIDPLGECARVAREAGLWYHVDAAWGGAVMASPRLSGLLAGIEHADSITIDAHKWFATTMACGMFVTRHAPILDAAFNVSTSFMPSQRSHVDPYVGTVQWSRRFLGLRLFLALGSGGWEAYATHVERSVDLVAVLRASLAERGWTIINDSLLAVLCVLPPAGSADVTTIAARVLATGHAWVAAASFEGRKVIRICVTHGEAGLQDIAQLTEVLEAAR
jgi:glutamate/tyrosine decarboxylase-like PLP-dependent enzyme